VLPDGSPSALDAVVDFRCHAAVCTDVGAQVLVHVGDENVHGFLIVHEGDAALLLVSNLQSHDAGLRPMKPEHHLRLAGSIVDGKPACFENVLQNAARLPNDNAELLRTGLHDNHGVVDVRRIGRNVRQLLQVCRELAASWCGPARLYVARKHKFVMDLVQRFQDDDDKEEVRLRVSRQDALQEKRDCAIMLYRKPRRVVRCCNSSRKVHRRTKPRHGSIQQRPPCFCERVRTRYQVFAPQVAKSGDNVDEHGGVRHTSTLAALKGRP